MKISCWIFIACIISVSASCSQTDSNPPTTTPLPTANEWDVMQWDQGEWQ